MPQISRRVVYTSLLAAVALVLLNLLDERGTTDPAFVRDQSTMALLRLLEKPQRQKVFVHFPGIFPMRVSCNLIYADKKWQAMLPGDEVTTTKEPATLSCSNGNEFHLDSGTTLRFWAFDGDDMRVELESGLFSVQASRPLQLVLSGALALAESKSGARLTGYAGSGAGFLRCDGGEVNLSLSRKMEFPLVLDSSDCLVKVKRRGEPYENSLVSGERSYVADLGLPPGDWPKLPTPPALSLFLKDVTNAPAISPLELSRGTNALGKPTVIASAKMPLDSCELFAVSPGASPRGLRKAAQLQGATEMEITKSEKRPLFVACKGKAGAHTSNLVAAIPRIAAKAPEITKAPQAEKAPVAAVPIESVPMAPAAPSSHLNPEMGRPAPDAPEVAH